MGAEKAGIDRETEANRIALKARGLVSFSVSAQGREIACQKSKNWKDWLDDVGYDLRYDNEVIIECVRLGSCW